MTPDLSPRPLPWLLFASGFRSFLRFAGLVSLAGLAVAACAEESGSLARDSQDQDESQLAVVRFDVEGSVVGAAASTLDEARSAYGKACADFEERLVELAGDGEIAGFSCSDGKDVGGSRFQIEGICKADVAALLPEGDEPAEVSPGDVVGELSTESPAARESWIEACDAAIGEARALIGERLLAATCGATKDTGGAEGYLHTGPLHLWIAPAHGEIAKLTSTLQGAMTTSRAAALASWRDACDAWARRTLKAGEHFESMACGEPKDIGGTQFLFESTATLQLVFPLEEDGEVEKVSEGLVEGEGSTARTAAWLAYESACDEAAAAAAKRHGERFLAASCETAQDVGVGQTFQYRGDLVVLLGDLAVRPEPPDGDEAGEDPPIDQGPRAEDCTARCNTLFFECGVADPVFHCDWWCNEAEATEAQIACAEEAECDVSRWNEVCKTWND
jgi:hypothetical protein